MKKPPTNEPQEVCDSRHVRTAAIEIFTRTINGIGHASWDRLSADGRMVECRAVMFCDVIKDRGRCDIDSWWRHVAIAVQNFVDASCEK